MPLILEVPGWRRLQLSHLVMDLNGTLALDGELADGAYLALAALGQRLQCHVVTADCHGNAAEIFADHPLALQVITPGDEAAQKLALVRRLGADEVCAVGNGANDVSMLEAAAVGIAVLGPEGAASAALAAADVVVPGALEALELLLKPQRLQATLRR